MGTSHADFDRMGSTILKLGNNFNSTEADILKMSSRLAGTAGAVGMTEAQMMGLATATSAVGIEAAVGATALNSILGDMQISVATGGRNLSNFADVAGKTSEEFARKFEQDAMGAVTAFIGGLNRMEDEGGNVAVTLYEMGFRADGVRQTLTNLAGGYDTLTRAVQYGSSAWYKNVELMRAVEERYNTADARLQVTKNQLRDVGITIGQQLLPFVVRLAERKAKLISAFGNLSPSVQNFAIVMGAVIAVSGPALTIGGKLVNTTIANFI